MRPVGKARRARISGSMGPMLLVLIAIALSPVSSPRLLGSAETSSRQAASRVVRFDLEEATIADLQRRMASGQDTARSLVEKYLARIEAIDRHGPSLHSVIETNPDARAI